MYAAVPGHALLGYGLLAGPCYVVVSLAQALTPVGFDLTRHDWSLLAAGPNGWSQMVNLVITGIMVVAFAIGTARVMLGTWVPRLMVAYGAGRVASGLLVADPGGGYPVGSHNRRRPCRAAYLRAAELTGVTATANLFRARGRQLD